MPHRPGTRDTLHQLLLLLQAIPRGRYVTAADLRDHLAGHGVARDIRSVQRQMQQLSRWFEIECDDRTKPFGYRWREQARPLAVADLDDAQALLLALAQRQLAPLLPPQTLQSLEPLFDQAGRALQSAHQMQDGRVQRGQARQWLDKVAVVPATQPLQPAAQDVDVWAAVGAALFANQVLEIDYRNASGAVAPHVIQPLAIVQQGPAVYLVARYEASGSRHVYHFAMHRVVAARSLGRSFERPGDFDLDRHVQDEARFGVVQGPRVRLSFSIALHAGQHLTETPLSTDQRVETHGDHYRVHATVVRTRLLQRWLQGFGDEVWDVRMRRAQAPAATGRPAQMSWR